MSNMFHGQTHHRSLLRSDMHVHDHPSPLVLVLRESFSSAFRPARPAVRHQEAWATIAFSS